MHSLTSWFTRNPVAANLLMLLILISGYFTLTSIRIEGFPALPPSSVSVSTFYPGASAEQVDRNITRRIELAVKGMPGLKRVSSISAENLSMITLRKVSGFDIDRFQNEIKTRVDSIPNLPQLADRPLITRDEFLVEALIVQLYGETDELSLQQAARKVKEELLAQPEISRLQLFGEKTMEIRVETDEENLRAYGLFLADVSQAIQASSLDYRKGNLRSENGRITIKADKKAFSYKDFKNIPVVSSVSGKRVPLEDIACIEDSFTEEAGFARFQGKPSVGMQIYTSKKGNLFEVSDAVKRVMKKMRNQLPPSMQLDVWGEYSVYMKKRLNLLKNNAVQGLLIVFVLLALFLNTKLAFWVAAGIPVSVAGTVAVMGERFLDRSLNDITTFGFIIVLGVLVDDAIVTGESVFEEKRGTLNPVDATIKGVNRVSTATVFGCFTTVAAFYPLLMIQNDLGKIFAGFSIVVIISILFSLVESKLILPAHLAHVSVEESSRNVISAFIGKLQKYAADFLKFLNRRIYTPVLTKALRNRLAAIILLIAFMGVVISMVFTGQIRTVFFPEIPGQIVSVNLVMNSGAPLKLTRKHLNRIETAVKQLNLEYSEKNPKSPPPIAKVMSALIPPTQALLYVELLPAEKSGISTVEIVEKWRSMVPLPEGAEQLTFSGSDETGGGFEIELSADNSKLLAAGVDRFVSMFREVNGVKEVHDDFKTGSPQIRLTLKPEAEHLGFRTYHLAEWAGDAFGGLEVQRMLREREEIRVYVKYRQKNRRYVSDLLNSSIKTSEGKWVPVTMIADISYENAPASVNRRNGRRTAIVYGKLDKDKLSSTEAFSIISEYIEPELQKEYPGLEIRAAGELEEMTELRGGIKGAFIVIIVAIYALLATPLKSYIQPVIIMSVVPFGFVGALLGHKITAFPLSILSFFGMMAVTGVVVNDSLVMITRFNELYRSGMSLVKAAVNCGKSRFRAVFLTTVTTVSGLLPLLLEQSEQAQYLKPAAISLAFGELIATPVTLVLIPLLITIIEDVKGRLKSKKAVIK